MTNEKLFNSRKRPIGRYRNQTLTLKLTQEEKDYILNIAHNKDMTIQDYLLNLILIDITKDE